MNNKTIILCSKTKVVIEFLDPPQSPLVIPSECSPEPFEIELNYEGTDQDFKEWVKNIEKLACAKSIDESYAEYVKEVLIKDKKALKE